ncbi:hypothetical protein EWM64_g1722 [Hericium alpestre]|uniref:AMP-dependent synthetase/ligase domain-containing protein n=1 Tax=Hericium alpestre TaxID=135208 RepID=A0A4Z0A7N8_9AGAM|nr:hypothetical protein EWM64_g1722 [Hericium alpestre]
MANFDKTVPLPPGVDYKRQSVAVPGTKRPGQTGAFGLFEVDVPGGLLKTLPEIFETGLARSRDYNLLGHRPLVSTNPLKFGDHFVWQTWAEVDARRRHIGSAIHHLFSAGQLGGGEYPTVGIWSQNRPEWQLVDFALHAYGKVGVSLYDTLGKDSVAHIYERTNELCVIAVGGSIGFFTGDPLRLLEDAQLLKPNFFPSVPRVLNRIYQAAMVAGSGPGLRGAIFRRAVAVKLQKLRTTGENTHPLWDRVVFRKIQAVLGGNLKLVTCGSAPITAEVMDFLRIALACDVLEGKHTSVTLAPMANPHYIGYGMTENGAVCSHVWPNDPTSSGTVGPPSAGIEMKLLDVPAMGYTSEDKPCPRGELCCRGPNCFSGYYKDEKNTKETVDEEAWIHTGDVAMIDECGRFKLIDRVKNIMKLAQGEYVALEKIENMYSSLPLVAQMYVHGDSLQAYLIGVIAPDPVQFAQLASRVHGMEVKAEDMEALDKLTRDQRVVDAVLEELTKEGRKNKLKGFEMVKRIHISMSPFSVEDNTMTPTLKIRRKDAYQKHKAALDALYALGEAGALSQTRL